MVSCCNVTKLIVAVVIICVGMKILSMMKIPPLHQVPLDQYWGPGLPPKTQDTSIKPTSIKFSPEMVADLKYRLSKTRYTEPLEGVAFNYGFTGKALKPVVDFWEKKYNFEEREKFLNQFPQFTTNIQGLDIHYIHVKPAPVKGVKVLPLLMLHGWPGSIREFYSIIPLLTTHKQGTDFVFELIIPCLPGYGFSQAASKPGLGATQMGVVMLNLMDRIGHKGGFYVQGGDWGSIIGSRMATLFSDRVLGYHTNMPFVLSAMVNIKTVLGSFWPSLVVDKEFEGRLYPLKEKLSEKMIETGYFHIQATKPDTVGAGITDSPAGLAAYILEKFSTATNPGYRGREDGGLLEKFTLTDLIDNLMFYWVSNSATTAVRLYAESFTKVQLEMKHDWVPTPVPTAAARFPFEIMYQTDSMLREKFPNLVQATDMPRGGHFAAFEEPALLAEDIRKATVKFLEFHENARRENDKKKEL